MYNATLTGMRNLWAGTKETERTMMPREMAETTWGKVWQDVNVAPDGTRWAFDAKRNVFIAY